MKALFAALVLGGLGAGGFYFYDWYFEPQQDFLESYQGTATLPSSARIAATGDDIGAIPSIETPGPADETPGADSLMVPAALMGGAPRSKGEAATATPAAPTDGANQRAVATKTTLSSGSMTAFGALAAALLEEKDLVARAQLLRRIMAGHAADVEAIDIVEQEATRVRDAGDVGLEWEALSFVFSRLGEGQRRNGVKTRLHELTDRIIFSRRPGPYSNLYRIQAGDSLVKIAARYYCPIDLIAKMNGIQDVGLIHQGERIKVIQGAKEVEVAVGPGETLQSIADVNNTTVETLVRINNLAEAEVKPGDRVKVRRSAFEILVDKSEFTLTVQWHGLFARQYTVGIGADGRTPAGEFVVRTRIPHPAWWKDGQRIPAGDPRNILGTMWLGFENTREVSGIGIHGTTQPESIGTEVSAGCIRMRNEDVEELALITPIGTRVRIID